jgi:hypothetical protein
LITAISDIKISGDGDFQATAIKSLLSIYHSFLVQLHTPSASLYGKDFLVFTGQVGVSAQSQQEGESLLLLRIEAKATNLSQSLY